MRIKNCILFLLLATSNVPMLSACDVCGSSVSSQSLGLLPQFSKHFVGLQYSYSSSISNHPSLFAGKPDEHTEQQFTNTQIWGRYQIAKRVQLFAFVPYVHSANQNSENSVVNNGIGDATLMGNVSFPFKQRSENKRLLLMGIGIKFPTGKYNPNVANNSLPNAQTGSGSWDFIANANYTQKVEKWGYNIDLSYLLTTANAWQYKFGNRLNASAICFYWIERKHITIVPQAGVKIEYALHDYDNYSKKWLNEKTGGIMNFASIGTQLFYKKIGFKATFQIPLYQHYASGYVHSNVRFESGFFLLF
ncbi:MAG: hypothetical protein QM530_10690 [Phycisphaerales bacterium]|nr:hypothetical protein [Phycisphaerales bacterium]